MSDSKSSSLTRRRVFAGAGAGAALAAAAVALPALKGAEVSAALTPQAAPDKGGGYSETPHVLHYYRTARV